MAKADPKEVFSTNLRRLRKATGLSQEAFALKAGLHRTYYGSIERGERNISLENIYKIAEAIPCYPQELLTPIAGAKKSSQSRKKRSR